LRCISLAILGTVTACESEQDRLAGTYVRTYKPGYTAPDGLDGEPERHALILKRDGTWSSEHPERSLQQFDVPMREAGRWTINGVLVTISPTDFGPMQYSVNGDTLFPRPPQRARLGEMATGMSMEIGTKTFLLREREPAARQ
jgi:hypothetical protein